MKKLFYVFMMSLAIGIISCSKDGAVGPEGQRGERGERGEKGETGAVGKDGNTILSGTSNPTSAQGAVGDFYINTASYLIFGPKTSSGWGSGKSVLGATGAKGDKGDKGDTGARGATGATGAKGDKGDKGDRGYIIYQSANDPHNQTFNPTPIVGDFFLNTTTKDFFQYGLISINPTKTGWYKVAKFSNTIQFTKTGVNLPVGNTGRVIDFDLPWTVAEKSVLNVYVKADNIIYPLPGAVGSIATPSHYRILFGRWGSTQTRLTISGQAGNLGLTNTTVIIVATEADTFKTISKQIDFRNYNEVSRYFNLEQ